MKIIDVLSFLRESCSINLEDNTTTERTLTYLSSPIGIFAVVETVGNDENLHYILKDHLGSWTTITDCQGNIEQELSFDAWGNRRNPETWLPNPYIDNCKTFYDNIGMKTLSWHYSREYWKELKQGVNVMEVHYELNGNLITIYIALSTAKRNRKNITQAYWFEDVDKYIYEYSCETNEWRLVEE